ncbi:DegT/DnrJ/EryC1/StrS aminotransferase family protein [Nocardiopsis sp. FIRDI 009]|uniref:DegT/DnrJ/EryC1/StrS family aminotransferase n=1 Tax=Nocardiopsis sp. FIRDI 009 TaxID=714197 RepID=UPI000E2328C7|nr:DegT/DnrJ/EryC1/StrS family aminotransferase [Nocardiopsis sp. FIRDI 009]
MTDRPAMFGGRKTVRRAATTRARIGWPVVTDEERDAVADVLTRGPYTSNDAGRGAVSALEADWARYVGTEHCAAVANGTAALELSLAALDIERGAEVLVPALTFVGTAVPVVQRGLVPVFVDVDPVDYTIDPVAAEAAVTPRTRAIIAVHLHGLPCDMTALRALADRHGLYLLEDAAQAQGARHEGRRAGSMGDINATSLNVVKNLPTCGEGGLVTTDREDLYERVVLHRQFGEDLRAGAERDYLSRVMAGNEKLSAVQAAFTSCQLRRLDADSERRDRVVRGFLARLAELPGVTVPRVPEGRTHAWHILRLRFDPVAAGFPDVAPGVFRETLRQALRAEGVPVQPYQVVPLPGQPLFASYGYRVEDFPVSLGVIEETLTLQRWHLNPASGPVLDLCADAFEKVWTHLDDVVEVGRNTPYLPPWHKVAALKEAA